MKIDILGKGAFRSALIHLGPGDEFVSESGAMFRASSNVDVNVTTKSRGKGGILGGLKRLLSSESFFFSTYRLTGGNSGEVGLAPTLQGDVAAVELDVQPKRLALAYSTFIDTGDAGLATDIGREVVRQHGIESPWCLARSVVPVVPERRVVYGRGHHWAGCFPTCRPPRRSYRPRRTLFANPTTSPRRLAASWQTS